jgi:peptidoglycan/xylan/chitin deacetylase (PgdA/CDA1 family)
MYFFSTLKILKKFYSKNIIWEMNAAEKSIWLTFDDGPDPVVTPWVLEELKKYKAKATFFCLGKNVESHPEIYESIIKEGHSVGNHSYDHKNGWRTLTKDYIADIEKCSHFVTSGLFRPPYGKIKPSQFNKLKQKYDIVLWSLMSGDFDINLSKEKCLDIVLSYTKNGTIILFHDSPKAKEKLEFVLPKFLEHFSNLGYSFPAL